jgi:hypothetical protein
MTTPNVIKQQQQQYSLKTPPLPVRRLAQLKRDLEIELEHFETTGHFANPIKVRDMLEYLSFAKTV